MRRVALAPALLALVLLSAANATPTLGQTTLPAEEFAGPFPSWNQVQCGGSDDTGTLQNALNNLGKPGNSPVLYIKPGTCRITSTLTLQGREKVTFLGADPATTRIVWGGPAGGTMFWINGVGHSRFGRITWDHNNTTGVTIEASSNNSPGAFFPTDNRHEDEVFVNLVTGPDGQLNTAVRLGSFGQGEAETTWIREKFVGGQAGMYLRNFNVLDHWIWDSSFQGLRLGVTNFIQGSGENGAGGYSVNRSVFLNNVLDLAVNNTNFMSARWNYSRGANWRFMQAEPVGSPINPMTFQGNTIVNAGGGAREPIYFGVPGPAAFLDNTVLSTQPIRIAEAYTQPTDYAEVLSVGNRYSLGVPLTISPGARVHQIDDQSGVTVTDPGPPALPSTPQNLNRPVFEVTSRDSAGLQAAVNQAAAAGTRAIVHLPYGNYDFGSTVAIPANATLQLVGDGMGATVIGGPATPLIAVNGPTQVVMRDFSMSGNGGSAQGIVVNNANQPNGLVHFEELTADANQVGLLLNGTNQTMVDSLDSQVNSTSSADYRATGGATLRIFNGASCCSTGATYDVQGGSTIVSQNMYFENGGPAQLIAPNGNGTVVADVGKVTGKPGTAANVSTFNGTSVLQNLTAVDGSAVVGGANTFLFGNTGNPDPTAKSTNYVNWGPRHDAGGGGTTQVGESSAGVSDPVAYARSHEAPLRAAVPTALTSRGSGVTDLRAIRLGGQNFTTFLTITGTPGTVSAAAVPAVVSAPVSLVTSSLTNAVNSTASTSGTSFVTGVTKHVPLRSDYTGQVGAVITIGSTPLTVTQLGRYVETGNSGTHTLAVYRASDSSLVASATLNLASTKPDGTGFAYAPLSTSVSLPAGGVYYLVSSETAGGDTWEGWPTFPTLAHTSVATVQGGVWLDGSRLSTSNTGSGPDQAYVPVSFKYQ